MIEEILGRSAIALKLVGNIELSLGRQCENAYDPLRSLSFCVLT